MENKYKVQVNGSKDFQFSREQIEALDALETSSSNYHVLKDNRSFKAEILKSDFLKRKYTVKINSNNYEVDISNELDLLIEEMGLSLGSSQLVNEIKAPMPGLILDVNVKEGDEVKEGDYLLVLEAMKMENTLTAPHDGKVKLVEVKKGQTVEKSQLLIEME
ncbi:acetyl-CoA carboxylase biotin carboxyl carrier protein subunit [Salegentibacter chungangensis]|uniref:Biotin/lipoyl-containing protein n=1 Tax=Salegentibacter chungangensis TaxID=1335724 RepID=A0ABW3NR91_9FLAO